jgi:formylglycine-generating enzyme required for sulfatase activity
MNTLRSPSLPGPVPAAGRLHGPLAVRPALLDCTGVGGVSAAEVRRAQEGWARYLGRKVEETVEVSGGVALTFVLVPPGRFLMGSPPGEGEREPYEGADEALHVVTLTEPFDLARTVVTQRQYRALTGGDPGYFKGDELPVETVSWEEADAYARKLETCRGDGLRYRLPTEAEWEYACRGGRPSSHPFGVGDGRSLASDQANFDGNLPYGGAGKGMYLRAPCAVASYPANALGLFDLHGNVWEWCRDWYGPYPRREVTNPTGAAEGPERVFRGGSWYSSARMCRAANRFRLEPGYRNYDLGFRLVRCLPSGSK